MRRTLCIAVGPDRLAPAPIPRRRRYEPTVLLPSNVHLERWSPPEAHIPGAGPGPAAEGGAEGPPTQPQQGGAAQVSGDLAMAAAVAAASAADSSYRLAVTEMMQLKLRVRLKVRASHTLARRRRRSTLPPPPRVTLHLAS